ncbi:NLR family, CARD domain containing 5 [Pristis pectinata]|uniref:NLR family, CARD domain containing 5 n=1 Tax=Pristis pectinata TaxID=685728 RepID=UPI00223E02D0|nr:NLR family, CARD domain containing 5 [Pristis pectinata]
MSNSGIKELLEINHGQLVESLSQHANSVIEKARTILNREEQELVDSQGTNEEKISKLLKRLFTKDNDTCKGFIQWLIITMPCDSFPMCLESSLMAAGEDNTQDLLHLQQNVASTEGIAESATQTQVKSSANDSEGNQRKVTLRRGSKRSSCQVENTHPIGVKKAKTGNYWKAVTCKSSITTKLTQAVLNADPEEVDQTLHQSGEEYLNLPAISDSAEDYRMLMRKTISQKYEASNTKEEKRKQVTLAQTFRSLSMKDRNVTKLKERIDASRDDVLSSHGVEENEDTVTNLAEFLNKKLISDCKVNILLGKAGTGKTKLVHKICYEWTRGVVSQFQYVFLFEFRQLNLINRSIDLKTMLFDLFLKPERNAHAVFRFIVRNPQMVLIIFDGFDEFAEKASVCTSVVSSNPNAQLSVGQLFSSLFIGKMLPGCTVLITSRPKDILCLPLDVVGHVGEVSGFNQCKIKEYASHFFEDTEHICKAISHLEKNRKILNMCYIPALCWVVFLCLEHLLSQSQLEPKLPHTMTQFYIKMLTVFLSKGAKSTEAYGQIENMLLNEYREEIHGLCNLAVKGLQESKSVFYLKDLLSEKVTMFASSFGFLSTFEVKTIDHNQENGYAFVHLTLQEFLAALHQMIDNQTTDQMLKSKFYLKSKWTWRNDAKNEFTDTVHIFLSGLASKRCKQFLSILANKNEMWIQKKQKAILLNLRKLATTNLTGPKIIELCHCVYETQNCDLARDVAAQLRYKFELRNFRLTPADTTVLTFVINNGTSCASVDIGGCALDLECVTVLGTCKNLETLVFKSRKYEDKFAQTLSEAIPKVNSLKKLILTSCSIGVKGASPLTSALGICQQLEEINLHDNELGDAGIEMVVNMLPRMAKLRKIELGGNNITVEGVLTIANVLRTCSNILDIQVSDGGNVATIRFLTDSTISPVDRPSMSLSPPMESEGSQEAVLRKLSLVKCKLTEQHMHSLCKILQHGPQLACIDLSGNELEDHGLRKLVEFLPEFHISKLINLSNNGFSESGVLCLVTVLKRYPNVLEIKVSLKCHQTVLIKFTEHCEGTDCRDELNTQLMDFRLSSTGDSKTMSTLLRKLSLTSCHFQLEHLEELGSTLEHCNDLAELDLSDNALGDRGFSKLVELLPKLRVGRLINVSSNFITMTGVLCLAKCMNKIKNITEVAISLGKSGKGLIRFHGDRRFHKKRELQEILFKDKCGKQSLHLPKKISIEECEMDGEAMRKLCLILKTCSALTELDLSNNALSNEAIAELLHHLPHLQDLETLNISDNSIPSDTVLLLAQSLNICENAQKVEVRSSGRASINFMKKCCRLEGNRKKAEPLCSRILSLRECNLHKMSVEQLFKILEHCKNLAEVDLSCNLLKDEGLQSLRDFLPKLPFLKLLNVSNNRISPTGVLYLVESLNICRNVVEVEVSLASNGISLLKFAKRCEKKVCSVKECNLKEKDLLNFFSIVERCTHLTELKLTSNIMGDEDLRNLVDVVGNLKYLEELNLQKNGISLTAVENLFVALNYCPKTLTVRFEEQWIHGADAANLVVKCVQTHLNIAEIRIKKNQASIRLTDNGWRTSDGTRMDSAVSYPSLRLISLQQCGIEVPHLLHLSSIIKQCPSLMELHLCQNNFGDKGAEILAEILQVVRGLRKLSLESTNMSSTGMVSLTAGLCKCRSLEEINLSHNELGEESASELGKVLLGLEQLRIINLPRMTAAAGLMETNALARGLSNCTSLEEINLDSLPLKDSGTQLLAEGIPRMTYLKRLNLKSNFIGCKGAVELANGLKYSTMMVEINLSDNYMEDVGAMKIADVLPLMKSLTILNLTQNNITAIGGERLAEALRLCPSMEGVHLSRNRIGDQTAKKLAKALPEMPCLKILNLHSCDIGADGGLSLAQGLVLCPNLREISLAENNIGTEGAMELALALRSLKSLKKLSLQLNRIDNSMAEELAAGLVCCPTVEEVILSWNNISDEGTAWLAEVLPRMRCLKKLDLEGNKITLAGAEKLAASLQQCSSVEVIRLWKNNIPKDRAQNPSGTRFRLDFSVYSSAL